MSNIDIKRIDRHKIVYKEEGKLSYPDLYNTDNLKVGFKLLKGQAIPGVDGATKASLSEKHLVKLSKELKTQAYSPVSSVSSKDKIVQATLKSLLEPLFESEFRDSSHGFRPKRSCHTALSTIKLHWMSVTWFITLRIEQLFEKVHHELLVSKLQKKIKDKATVELIRKLLKAGYYNNTSLISPLFCNVFFDDMDKWVEDELIPNYRRGERKKANNQRITQLNEVEEKFVQHYPEAKETVIQLKRRRKILQEEDFSQLHYVRYANEILLGYTGKHSEAEEIAKKIDLFLKEKYTLSLETSNISSASRELTPFLGALIGYRQSLQDGTNCRLSLLVPVDILLDRMVERGYAVQTASGRIRATANKRLSSSSHRLIVSHYSSVIRALVNYYSFASHLSHLWRIVWLYRKSCALTLAVKDNLNSALAATRKYGPNFRITEGGIEVATLYYPTTLKATGKFYAAAHTSHSAILNETFACELCGGKEKLELYNINTMRNIPVSSRELMRKRQIALNRKTITLCRECEIYSVHRKSNARQNCRAEHSFEDRRRTSWMPRKEACPVLMEG